MAESADSMFRQGLISEREFKRLGAKSAATKAARGTKVQPSKMAEFDNKEGRRDQGGVRDRGDRLAGNGHINRMRNPKGDSAIAKRPSKRALAGREHQPGTDEIDESDNQKPAFPRGDRMKRRGRVGVSAPGKSSGPQYGGPSSRADG